MQIRTPARFHFTGARAFSLTIAHSHIGKKLHSCPLSLALSRSAPPSLNMIPSHWPRQLKRMALEGKKRDVPPPSYDRRLERIL